MRPTLSHDPDFYERTQRQADEIAKRGAYHTLELPNGTVIPGIIGVEALKARIRSFPIPEDLRGKRVLDVGAASGWNSFEMERRGASVVAVDCVEFEEFQLAHKMLDSKVDYRLLDVDELTPEALGTFDYVLFFGVLYHLRHPLFGLERISALTREAAFVESFVIDSGPDTSPGCTMEFYETDELGGQIDNWCAPNTNCLMALCRAAGFARVVPEHFTDRRAGLTCYRKWEPVPVDAKEEPPRIHAAVNNRTNAALFNPGKDEYICVYFTSPQQLTKGQLCIEIDGYGLPVLTMSSSGRNGWQANLKLPALLANGDHEVRMRTTQSAFSNVVSIHVGEARSPAKEAESCAPQAAPRIYAVESNLGATTVFRGYKNEYLCVWFESDIKALRHENVIVEVDDRETQVVFLGDVGEGRWQVNSRLPANLTPGSHMLHLRTAASPFSDDVEIRFDPQ
jgi:tRNA (mo5U34)-methyltransferase